MASQWHWASLLPLLGVFIRRHCCGYFESSWTWFSSRKGDFSLLQAFWLDSAAWDSFLKANVTRKDWSKKNIENLRVFCVFCCWQQMGLLPHLEAGTYISSFSFFCLCISRSPSCSLSPVVFFSPCAYPVYVRAQWRAPFSSMLISCHICSIFCSLVWSIFELGGESTNSACPSSLQSCILWNHSKHISEPVLWSCRFFPCLHRTLNSAISWSLQTRLLLTFTSLTGLF